MLLPPNDSSCGSTPATSLPHMATMQGRRPDFTKVGRRDRRWDSSFVVLWSAASAVGGFRSSFRVPIALTPPSVADLKTKALRHDSDPALLLCSCSVPVVVEGRRDRPCELRSQLHLSLGANGIGFGISSLQPSATETTCPHRTKFGRTGPK